MKTNFLNYQTDNKELKIIYSMLRNSVLHNMLCNDILMQILIYINIEFLTFYQQKAVMHDHVFFMTYKKPDST